MPKTTIVVRVKQGSEPETVRAIRELGCDAEFSRGLDGVFVAITTKDQETLDRKLASIKSFPGTESIRPYG